MSLSSIAIRSLVCCPAAGAGAGATADDDARRASSSTLLALPLSGAPAWPFMPVLAGRDAAPSPACCSSVSIALSAILVVEVRVCELIRRCPFRNDLPARTDGGL